MTNSHSGSKTSRTVVWGAVLLFAAYAAACGGTAQSMMGTAPSSIAAVASATEDGGTFNALKEGKGRGPDKGGNTPAPATGTTPTTGTTPSTGTPDTDDPETGDDHRGGAMQIEGFTTSVTGTCPVLTIAINGMTVKTDAATDFQRADCSDLAPAVTTPPPTTTTPPSTTTPPATTTAAAAPSFHLHIAAKKDATGALVATYVRMQGPKIGGGDDDDDDTTTPPTTGTTPTV